MILEIKFPLSISKLANDYYIRVLNMTIEGDSPMYSFMVTNQEYIDYLDTIFSNMPSSFTVDFSKLPDLTLNNYQIAFFNENGGLDSNVLADLSPHPFNYRASLINNNYYLFYCSYKFNTDIIPFFTDLYPELLDNEETKLSLQDWIDDDGTQRWDILTDKDLKAMELIEKYNKNVLLLRSTRKVQASVTGSISSPDGSSVNLTGVENKLQNINNSLNDLNDKFEVEEQVDGDVEIKSLTQVVKDLDLSNQTVVTTVESAPYNPLLNEGEDIYNS